MAMMTTEERLAWRQSVRAAQLAVASDREDAWPDEAAAHRSVPRLDGVVAHVVYLEHEHDRKEDASG